MSTDKNSIPKVSGCFWRKSSLWTWNPEKTEVILLGSNLSAHNHPFQQRSLPPDCGIRQKLATLPGYILYLDAGGNMGNFLITCMKKVSSFPYPLLYCKIPGPKGWISFLGHQNRRWVSAIQFIHTNPGFPIKDYSQKHTERQWQPRRQIIEEKGHGDNNSLLNSAGGKREFWMFGALEADHAASRYRHLNLALLSKLLRALNYCGPKNQLKLTHFESLSCVAAEHLLDADLPQGDKFLTGA